LGFAKARTEGFAKHAARLITLIALSNFRMASRRG
jgi:hypothetical protein